MSRHILDIEPRTTEGLIRGLITFHDGTQVEVYADERARVIAKAQRAVEQYERERRELRRIQQGETLYLDEHGEIVTEPADWSVRA